jgi:short-subunit dehydrogenase
MRNHNLPRRVLITGASSGIGYELARIYLAQGATVFAAARSTDALAKLVAEFPRNCVALAVDLADDAAAQAAGAKLSSITDYLDLAILNAGTCEYVNAQKFRIEPFARVTSINWMGAVHTLAFCLPLLRNAKVYGRPAQLAGISSMASLLPMPRSQAYGASKVALEYMLNSLRVDLADDDIAITLVRPGFVKTPLTDRNDFSMPGIISAADAAKRIQRGIAARKWIVQFPWSLVAVMTLIAHFPLRIQTSLLKRISRTSH